MFAVSSAPLGMGLNFAEQTEEWAFYSQLGRIFDAFSELETITPQGAQSAVDYLFPKCEMAYGAVLSMNDIIAQLLMPFVGNWMEAAGMLHRTYRWDDPMLANFSNRATVAAMSRSKARREAHLQANAA